MSGAVFLGSQRIEKVSQLIPSDSQLNVKDKDHPYVSRGGVKLKAAIDHFKLNVKDRICLDVGVSSGGFTDCLLKEGARKVYALDVGYGQVDWSLRNDPRVVVIEKTNFRYFDQAELKDPIDLVAIDVSFISLTKMIPKAIEILQKRSLVNPLLIALIKPQFEVGKGKVGAGGIVRDQKLQIQCVEKIEVFCKGRGLSLIGTLPSPMLGRSGNQEYLFISCLTL